jgi:hypothetical protein
MVYGTKTLTPCGLQEDLGSRNQIVPTFPAIKAEENVYD